MVVAFPQLEIDGGIGPIKCALQGRGPKYSGDFDIQLINGNFKSKNYSNLIEDALQNTFY